jgi:peptide/nickel transport system permease protein
MLRFILRRLLEGVVLLLVISFIAFSLLFVGGGDIARRILGQNASADVVAAKAAELGLDRPLIVQYFDWLGSAFQGDFGRSWFTGQLVATGVSSRLAVTLSIVIGATLVSAVIAVVLGVLAARRGGWVDAVVQFITVIGFAIPGFLIALYLVLIFAINLGWFKATGYIPLTTSFTGWLTSVTLPIAALSFAATTYARSAVAASA